MTDIKKLLMGDVAAFSPMAAARGALAQSSQANPPADDDEGTEIEGNVVTGSRIRRDAFNSASPVQAITAEEAALKGLTDIGELLQTSAASLAKPCRLYTARASLAFRAAAHTMRPYH